MIQSNLFNETVRCEVAGNGWGEDVPKLRAMPLTAETIGIAARELEALQHRYEDAVKVFEASTMEANKSCAELRKAKAQFTDLVTEFNNRIVG